MKLPVKTAPRYTTVSAWLCGEGTIATPDKAAVMATFSVFLAVCDKQTFNTLSRRQDGRHFPDNIFKYIFKNKNT